MDRCPQCGTDVAADDFQCARCELLLNPEATIEIVVSEPSVVRALLGPAQPNPTGEFPIPVVKSAKGRVPLGDEVVTAEFLAPVGPQLVPRIVAGLDVAGKLDGFEAYIASFIDGAQGTTAIATVARVAEIEVQAVLRTLRERRVIDIVPRPASVPRAGPAALKAAISPGRRAARRDDATSQTFAAPPPRRSPPVVPAGAHVAVSSTEAPRPAQAPQLAQPPPMPRFAPASKVEAPPPPRRMVPLDAPVPGQDREENVLQHAVALERSGEIDGAIHVLKRGIARVKNPAALYNRLALILLHQRRDYREAEELLRQALEVEPDHPVYQQNLFKVIALAAAGSKRPERKSGGLLDRIIRRK